MSSALPYGWYEYKPDGEEDLGVPSRLLSHPEVQRRGLVLTDTIRPGVLFSTRRAIHPAYVVKILDPNGEELPIYQRLLREIRRPNNHTIPCEITLNGHPLLIMPFVDRSRYFRCDDRSPRALIDMILQLVEGMEYLHSQHIVHMDMCPGNVLAGTPQFVAVHEKVDEHKLYIIDFNTSRQFALGPGVQPAVKLPHAQLDPPNGLTVLDPYSWDMYCTGRTLEELTRARYRRCEEKPHRLALKYIQWLIGDERGCAGVCRCRPTARTALRVVLVLQWAVDAPEGYSWVVDSLSYLWPDGPCRVELT